eukprot:4821466-Pyramimonas_sp.AAC.1
MAWLILFCACRCACPAVEQPHISLMFSRPVLKITTWTLDASRLTPAPGAFGSSSAKPLEV